MNNINKTVLAFISVFAFTAFLSAQDYKEVTRYKAHYAYQAVAVGKDCFFAIENQHITKFSMQGDSLRTWHEPDKDRIRHLNSGVVIGNRLYCAHSNYPKYPMASSIEIFDVKTLRHIDSISFGIDTGSHHNLHKTIVLAHVRLTYPWYSVPPYPVRWQGLSMY